VEKIGEREGNAVLTIDGHGERGYDRPGKKTMNNISLIVPRVGFVGQCTEQLTWLKQNAVTKMRQNMVDIDKQRADDSCGIIVGNLANN